MEWWAMKRGIMDIMARPTQIDVSQSVASGGALSPSQVNRLRAAGLGPPPGSDIGTYWAALAPYVGTGRDLDVAAVRMATEGYATARLRTVISAPADDARGGQIVEILRSFTASAAAGIVRDGTWRQVAEMPETPGEEACYLVDGASLDFEDALAGVDPSPLFIDAAQISARIATDARGLDGPQRELYPDEFSGWFAEAGRRLSVAEAWAKTAPAAELVAEVQALATLWHATAAGRLSLGDEDTWRMIAGLAPVASLLVELVAEVQSQITTGAQVPLAAPPDQP